MSPAPHRLGLPFRHPAALVASGFGLGLLPAAPGSWASLAALPIAWILRSALGLGGLAAAAALACAIGWWAAAKLVRAGAGKDPGAIVIDEIAGQWLTLLAASLALPAYALGFVLFRLFDVWKPWPVRWADRRVGGGLGVMLDDVLAAGYAVLILWAVGAVGVRF